MFTGIVREIGILQKKERREEIILLTIQSRGLIAELKPGSSIAVNGVCLTIEHLFKDAFKAAVVPETLQKTNLGLLYVSSRVNLEPALKVGDQIGGHFVTGHVDCVGKVKSKETVQGGRGLTIEYPKYISKYLAFKGSVALNGVSLTIADLKEDAFSVALIPYTIQNTNLGDIKEQDIVNIEVDVIARYLDSLNSASSI